MPTTVVTIDGVAYDNDDRAGARWTAGHELTKNLDGGYDSFNWSIRGVGPSAPAFRGKECIVEIDSVVVFKGDVVKTHQSQSSMGWVIKFSALCLKYRADHIPVTASDGGGSAVYNRSPLNDPLYVASDAGLSVGQIVERVLEITTNAAALLAAGVGNYSGGGPYSLPSATTTDLAALTVVPPRPVILEGPGIINELEALITRWHPKYALFIKTDGTIRIINTFTMSAQTLVVPGETGTGDEVTWPAISSDIDGCYTAVQATGRDIQMAVLRLSDGTLFKGWSGADESAWTIEDFTKPKDAYDWGTITTCTLGNATVQSARSSVAWSSNFWANRLGHITCIYAAGSGIDMVENRSVTSNGALTAGGTTTVTWDATVPLPNTNYTSYILVGTAGVRVDVGRLYYVREPSSGATGTSTFLGPRLLPASPRPLSFGNNGRTANSALGSTSGGLASGPVAQVMWSSTGATTSLQAFPITLQVVPSLGAIRLDEPDVKATSLMSDLETGYPTTYATGKPVDIVAMVPYNRGGLVARKPATSYEGTAYTEDGLERILQLFIDDWTYSADSSNIELLCQEHLDTVKDIVWEGSITHRGYPSFDPLDMGYSLALSVSGTSVPWDSINHPVRSVTVRWNPGEGLLHAVEFHFGNRQRPFQGDDLYIHPANYSASSSGQAPFGDQPQFTPQYNFNPELATGFPPSEEMSPGFTLPLFAESKRPSAVAKAGAGAILGGVNGADSPKPSDGIRRDIGPPRELAPRKGNEGIRPDIGPPRELAPRASSEGMRRDVGPPRELAPKMSGPKGPDVGSPANPEPPPTQHEEGKRKTSTNLND